MKESPSAVNRPAHTNVFTGLELLRNNTFPTGPIAIDCEMVGVGPKDESALARVSIVDHSGRVLYDVICRPDGVITNYRTPYSGIQEIDMANGLPFDRVQSDVKQLIENRILVGHAISNDFSVLKITHPLELVRDTSTSRLLLKMANRNDNRQAGLKRLTQQLLRREIQQGEHDSVEDARATMDLFRLVEGEWENQLRSGEAPVTNEPTFNSYPSITASKSRCRKFCCFFCK